MTARAAALALAGFLAIRPVDAQAQARLSAEALLATARFRGTTLVGEEALTGVLAGGRGRFALGACALEVQYVQGRLSSDSGNIPSRDYVDGSVFLAVRAAPWLELKAGPHLRAYVAPGGTERWALWEGRAHLEAPIIPGTLRAHVEGWASLVSGVNANPGAAGARGGEVGMALHVAQSPLLVRLAYTVDQEAMRSSVRTEVLEAVVLSIGIGGQ